LEKKNRLIIFSFIIVIMILISVSGMLFQIYLGNKSKIDGSYVQITQKTWNKSVSTEILGNSSYGMVVKQGPYGNKDSSVKIAYIVGVHPLEFNSHRAVVESIKNHDKSLKYCYYIYKIIVARDAKDYDKGRMNGQLLALKYVVPNIKNQYFDLAIDVHSNRGNYNETRFVFAPVDRSTSKSIALKVENQIQWLVYYLPTNEMSPSSPKYVTIPLINAGIPAIVYETYKYEDYQITEEHADEFVRIIDNMKL